MKANFLKLTQGMKSVVEYEEQFTDLSHFAPTLVTNEGNKCRKLLKKVTYKHQRVIDHP